MKILLLMDANASHSIKWINEYYRNGVTFKVLSLQTPEYSNFTFGENEKIFYSLPLKDNQILDEGSIKKIGYFRAVFLLLKAIREFQPDIVHAHYASSYGMIGALSQFHPFVISVWGSDVMSFPEISALNKLILRYNLNKSTAITASSNFLKEVTQKYTSREISVIPFGIDIRKFSPQIRSRNEKKIVLCSVKGLEEYYGIDTLIEAFRKIVHEPGRGECSLIIAGDGSQREHYQQKIESIGLKEKVKLIGHFPYSSVQDLYNDSDICIFASSRESFGVAVLEAEACGRPVIVSDIPGFKEVYREGETALSFRQGDPEDLAAKIRLLSDNQSFRKKLGDNGVKFVNDNFLLINNVNMMLELYSNLLRDTKA